MRVLARGCRQCRSPRFRLHVRAPGRVGTVECRRGAQVQAAPSSESSGSVNAIPDAATSPDAVFEVVGTPYSLLSVTLDGSQPLNTRRGTLVGLSGDPHPVVSFLRLLSPFRRALVGIPFLYQRLTSATPITALISPKSTSTSLAVLRLDGTTDWKIVQSKSLLAWSGSTLLLHPAIRDSHSISLATWGSTTCSGRGLLALEGKGNIFSVTLAGKESYVVHPSNVLAYSSSTSESQLRPPTPYRFKHSALSLTIPSYPFTDFFPQSRFLTNLQNSDTWVFLSKLFQRIRTWLRRRIWGDRLFYQFTGPTTIIIQSRASHLRDVLADRDVNNIAHVPPGKVQETLDRQLSADKQSEAGEQQKISVQSNGPLTTTIRKPTKLSIATVQRDGVVRVEETPDFQPLSNQ